MSIKINFNPNFDKMVMDAYDKKTKQNLEKIQDIAKAECPVKTGKLRNDIDISYDELTHEGVVGNSLDYAIYVNLNYKPYLELGLYGANLDYTSNGGEQ